MMTVPSHTLALWLDIGLSFERRRAFREGNKNEPALSRPTSSAR
jgi:hypothetical protein